uniref:Uncharacterized protein n=1 Tax=Leersia perrieri TaxID=77586 RepID=A0A0D9X9H2_9ORYZ
MACVGGGARWGQTPRRNGDGRSGLDRLPTGAAVGRCEPPALSLWICDRARCSRRSPSGRSVWRTGRGSSWCAAAASGEEEVKVDPAMFDGAAVPPPDAPLSLIVEVTRANRVLSFICSAWPDEPLVRHVLTLRQANGSSTGNGGRQKLGAKEREVDDELARFLHEYMTNKEKTELLRWLMIVESFVE